MPRYDFEQFAAVRAYSSLSFSPDGRWLCYVTNASGQFNVWKQPVAVGPDGQPFAPVQLTALVEDAARQAVWSPDGSRILTAADFHGTENFQIYEIPAERGWLYPITQNHAARHQLPADPFSPDGRRIVYATNERNPADMDAAMRDLVSGQTHALLAGDANYFPAGFSPDGRYVVVARLNSNTDQDIFLCDTLTGENRHLTPHEGEVKYFPGPWSPDSRGFYLVTDQGREFSALAYIEIEGGALDLRETPDWDVSDVALSKDGRYLAWVVNMDGYSRLSVRDLQTGEARECRELPEGVIAGIELSPTEPLLAVLLGRPVRPANIYTLDLENGAVNVLSQGFLGGIPEEEMVEPELVRYPTHDGREIPAFLFRPREMAGERAPVVLSVHGGPEAQELPGYAYAGLYQYLLDRGIGVLAPNIRGSTGYGKSYQKLIHRDWGGAELGDLEQAVVYLRGLDWVDPERLGVFGGSFGGFATLSCVARLPDYWAAAADIVGPSNLVTFTRAVPPFWKRLMKDWVGDPDEDVELLQERSPITYVENVRTPLLVIQGANDPRVVKAESDQMVERLRALEEPVEYLVFEDEGHGFTKTANMLTAMRATAGWFERFLLNGQAAG